MGPTCTLWYGRGGLVLKTCECPPFLFLSEPGVLGSSAVLFLNDPEYTVIILFH